MFLIDRLCDFELKIVIQINQFTCPPFKKSKSERQINFEFYEKSMCTIIIKTKNIVLK